MKLIRVLADTFSTMIVGALKTVLHDTFDRVFCNEVIEFCTDRKRVKFFLRYRRISTTYTFTVLNQSTDGARELCHETLTYSLLS